MSGAVHLASRPAGGTVIAVAAVGRASGARAAAAALACGGSPSERAGLLIDLGGGRPTRPSLLASAAARELEERLVAHLPEAAVASKGRICRLALPEDPGAVERIPAALPPARESVAVVHVAGQLFRSVLEEPRIGLSGVLLRADLGADRALTALLAAELIESGLRVAILKQPLNRLPARLALAGLLPGGGLPPRLAARLLGGQRDTFCA